MTNTETKILLHLQQSPEGLSPDRLLNLCGGCDCWDQEDPTAAGEYMDGIENLIQSGAIVWIDKNPNNGSGFCYRTV